MSIEINYVLDIYDKKQKHSLVGLKYFSPLHCLLNVKRQGPPIYSLRLQATLGGEDTILQNKEDRFIPFQPTYVCAALWSAPIDCLIRDIISCSSIIHMIVSKRH